VADFGRGIKAGLVTAMVYLIISVILGLTHFSYQFPDVTTAAGLVAVLPQGAPTVYSLVRLLESWASFCALRGIIFGVVFAALYNFLPSAASVKKGVVLSAFLWMVAVVGAIYTTLGWPTDGFISDGAYYSGVLNLSSPGMGLVGIMSALAFGALTGFLWDRFRTKKLAEARKGSAVLLVSFIVGGLIWVVVGPLYVIGVVIRGVSLWESIGLALVAVIGLPGWVLALVAWRKMKRGESGFKWGLAGGVIMALTGIMLLPGALAITGGVLSGRKPASESSTPAIGQ
jgi:hypothetical protein